MLNDIEVELRAMFMLGDMDENGILCSGSVSARTSTDTDPSTGYSDFEYIHFVPFISRFNMDGKIVELTTMDSDPKYTECIERELPAAFREIFVLDEIPDLKEHFEKYDFCEYLQECDL